MISRSEHMINAMIERMEELRDGKHGDVKELTFHKIMMHVFDIAKCYTVDRKEVINLMGNTELTPSEVKMIMEFDYEDNSKAE